MYFIFWLLYLFCIPFPTDTNFLETSKYLIKPNCVAPRLGSMLRINSFALLFVGLYGV